MATSTEQFSAAPGPEAGAPSPAAVRETAAGWVARLQDPEPAEATLLGFDEWLSASAAHREAYDQALRAWLSAGAAAARQKGAPGARRARPRARIRATSTAGARALGWAALAAAAVAAALVLQPFERVAPPAQIYATGRGEHRLVSLADGTRIDLNAATRIEVRLAGDSRRVILREGEAAFDVRHDPARAFLVSTRDGQIEDLGTAFDVRQRGPAFSVTVSRGEVRFAPAGASADRNVRLGPGDRLERIGAAKTYRVRQVSAEDDFDWRRGVLVFRGEPLGSVVAELNLQFTRPLRVSDPALAARPISGVLRLEDERTTIRHLALFSPMTVVERGGVTVLEPASDRKP